MGLSNSATRAPRIRRQALCCAQAELFSMAQQQAARLDIASSKFDNYTLTYIQPEGLMLRSLSTLLLTDPRLLWKAAALRRGSALAADRAVRFAAVRLPGFHG